MLWNGLHTVSAFGCGTGLTDVCFVERKYLCWNIWTNIREIRFINVKNMWMFFPFSCLHRSASIFVWFSKRKYVSTFNLYWNSVNEWNYFHISKYFPIFQVSISSVRHCMLFQMFHWVFPNLYKLNPLKMSRAPKCATFINGMFQDVFIVINESQ